MANVVLHLEAGGADHLREVLEAWGFELEDRPHAFFLARGDDATLTAYRSGKVLVNGGGTERLVQHLLARKDLALARSRGGASGGGRTAGGTARRLAGGPFQPRIGTDESGKGDYFGPLVVAGVHVGTTGEEAGLASARVRDSKTMTTRDVHRTAEAVRDAADVAVEVLDPPAYNARYREVGNLNVLLAEQHARCIRALHARHGSTGLVVVDRFARGGVLRRALHEGDLDLREVPRGESRDTAVAAASVVARAVFLDRMDALSARWGATFPRGAGAPVLAAGRRFLEAHDADELGQVAKLHFRTTGQLRR